MKIALLGYGKMGKTIHAIASEKGHEVVFTRSSSSETGNLAEADVAIEFSSPEAAVANLMDCMNSGIPVVCGTTGWLKDYDEIIKLCESRNTGFIYASNFSVGVNLFFQLNEYLSKMMNNWKEYNPEIEEIHHTQKKDAPSGTAITIAEGMIENLENRSNWSLNMDSEEIIQINAVREGDVKGTHRVDYRSKIDTISIQHEAHTRDGFALGAILAAEWLIGKKGVFTMKDVLELN